MNQHRNHLRAFALLSIISALALPHANAQKTLVDPEWRFTLRKPRPAWTRPDFKDSRWAKGYGGFGTSFTPGSRVGTPSRTNDIWLRTTIELKAVPKRPALLIHHDEDAEIYLNGQQIATFTGYTKEYQVVPLSEKAQSALHAGKNVLAVHCKQTGGGQFIDVHIVDADNVPKLAKPKLSTTPFQSELITKWGQKVTPENAWREYPRPQLVRAKWENLNGKWDYAITPKKQKEKPSKWAGKILVPFCLESRLSGVQRLLNPDEALWYHRTFDASPKKDRRTILNFEAVDYRCQVMVNDKLVAEHVGGNTPFSVDITSALKQGTNELVVRVEDETDGFQLRGKQTLHPHGIWYTRVSGIWQTVWLEEVSARYLKDVKITTNPKSGTISIKPIVEGSPEGEKLEVVASFRDKEVAKAAGKVQTIDLKIESPKLWSPTSPNLYDLKITLSDPTGKVIDEVASYAGIRSVGKVRDKEGHLRFTLNGKNIFHWGPLDQGWWPDGLLTPPSDEAMVSDIKFLKSAGFNMIRKHIKVEPRRYYYHCDRIGMMVWQDQVSGGANPRWTRLAPNPRDARWPDEHHAQFLKEFDAMVATLENHPSIVVWVPFNEAWGQHRTVEVGKWIAKRDPTRLVNIASGGNFWPVGDIVDSHRYPHPGFPFDPKRFKDYVRVMGEFGGHGWMVKGHLWDTDRENWGYGGLPKNLEELKARYRESIRLLTELQKKGIAAGVYTQTTDVEGEINGLMTYDRKVIKIPVEDLRKIHQSLFSEE